jgi:hypothetical protein
MTHKGENYSVKTQKYYFCNRTEKRNETERTDLKKEIERLTITLQETPDPVELAEVKAYFEGLQMLLEERERLLEERNNRINDLTREVEDIRGFAHYFKNVEVKQIEAPTEQKVKKSFLIRLKICQNRIIKAYLKK